MKRSLYFLVVYQLFCTQNISAQLVALANGYPYQGLFANPNQILNLRQPAPVYNYIQSQPNLPAMSRQPNRNVPINQLQNLPPTNQQLGLPVLNGLPVLYNMPVANQANNFPIRNNVPAVPFTNQIYTNAPLVNQLSSYPFGNVPIVNQGNPWNSLPINALPFGGTPVINQLNSFPLVNPLNSVPVNNLQVVNGLNGLPTNTVPFANVPSGNSLASALSNLLYNGLVLPNKQPIINNVPSYSNLPLPVNNLQLIDPYQILNNAPVATYLPSTAPNLISSLPIVNTVANNVNRNPVNILPVNGVVLGQPNSLPVLNSAILTSPQPINSLPIAKDYGSNRQGFTLLIDNDWAEPLVSLNGLQLGGVGGFGNLPLFNGLPVIGMKESIINLKAV